MNSWIDIRVYQTVDGYKAHFVNFEATKASGKTPQEAVISLMCKAGLDMAALMAINRSADEDIAQIRKAVATGKRYEVIIDRPAFE